MLPLILINLKTGLKKKKDKQNIRNTIDYACAKT